jgi:hypothetical protein
LSGCSRQKTEMWPEYARTGYIDTLTLVLFCKIGASRTFEKHPFPVRA